MLLQMLSLQRFTSLFVAIVLFAVRPALADDLGKFFEDALGAIEKERQGKWRQINWHTDPAKALAAAQRERKPLLVFLHVRGQFNFDPRPEAC